MQASFVMFATCHSVTPYQHIGVDHTNKHTIQLKLLDDDPVRSRAVQLYLGVWEHDMVKQALKEAVSMPPTYDLMGTIVTGLGYRVVAAVVEALKAGPALSGSQFYTGSVLVGSKQSPGVGQPTQRIEARPSDAINLALRCRAPIYIAKDVAQKMAQPFQMPVAKHQLVRETAEVIRATCREIIHRHLGPLAPLHVDLAVAVARENYAQAARLRDMIEARMAKDQLLSLVRAMDAALKDGRHEEAAQLRDTYLKTKLHQTAATGAMP